MYRLLLGTVVIAAAARAHDNGAHSISELHNEYSNVFKTGNRNAASHKWAKYILDRSETLTRVELEDLFRGFCPTSGSPVTPRISNTWRVTVPTASDPESVYEGIVNFCCWPCVCDTEDLTMVDTLSISTADGKSEHNFLVIADPCKTKDFKPPLEAPEISCKNGALTGAVRSDNGHIIIGMIFSGDSTINAQDSHLVKDRCVARERANFDSGMGKIFREVAASTAQVRGDTPTEDIANKCNAVISDGLRNQIEHEISSNSVVLYGSLKCSCTRIAEERFYSQGICFIENTWSDYNNAMMKYLQCKYGHSHHSFVFFGGKFFGNGFALRENEIRDEYLRNLVSDARGRFNCQTEGDLNLHNKPLRSCTQENDGSTTGWTRTGSCAWDPTDSGYHQVCVEMSNEFLLNSAHYDANDLSSVVAPKGHWCICAWAFAAAVQRDPDNYEGIVLDCERTNKRLRSVYRMYIKAGEDLRSPSGAYYKAAAALDAVNKICGEEKEHGSDVYVPTTKPGVDEEKHKLPLPGDLGNGESRNQEKKEKSGGISAGTIIVLVVATSLVAVFAVQYARKLHRTSGEVMMRLKSTETSTPEQNGGHLAIA